MLRKADELVLAAICESLGSATKPRIQQWYVREDTYLVASVRTSRPALRLVVKLEVPGKRPNRHFDVMASIARAVKRQTDVPTFDVVAVDITRARYPWDLLIVTELPGERWDRLFPDHDAAGRAVAQHQIGRAAAQINALAFDGFGELEADGSVREPCSVVPALRARAQRRIRKARHSDFALASGGASERLCLDRRCTPRTRGHESVEFAI